jgi:hypothetical protein
VARPRGGQRKVPLHRIGVTDTDWILIQEGKKNLQTIKNEIIFISEEVVVLSERLEAFLGA